MTWRMSLPKKPLKKGQCPPKGTCYITSIARNVQKRQIHRDSKQIGLRREGCGEAPAYEVSFGGDENILGPDRDGGASLNPVNVLKTSECYT